ncbi:DUF1463 family protein [Borrelia crocidurae]|uniref:Uncharacterized protein n=1 Tax=Borrelia crocidurae (strain Achema) TaxID=1155096 RepID=I0FEG0_BORCA|nr:DUF1463 family protein [Borrelia crocidurae]AFI31866.1 Protein of unknown function (DUF1463)-containing protein [Borrelia crocidurae str. Achema]
MSIEHSYDLRNVYFSIDDRQINGGKLEYDVEPKELAVLSAEDRGFPIASFRDPNTLVHIFNIEVTLGSENYLLLNELAKSQFFSKESKENKYKAIVFNDGIDTKIVSNNAVFTEIPTKNYSAEADKVTFVIKAINCKITKPKRW